MTITYTLAWWHAPGLVMFSSILVVMIRFHSYHGNPFTALLSCFIDVLIALCVSLTAFIIAGALK